jgi:DNA-binding response OmpR family regulator
MLGKDKSGKYHPPKGKPSGSPRKANEVIGKTEILNEVSRAIDAPMDEVTDVHIRHQNRHQEKDQEAKSEGPKQI